MSGIEIVLDYRRIKSELIWMFEVVLNELALVFLNKIFFNIEKIF